jgi:hypothetical protein
MQKRLKVQGVDIQQSKVLPLILKHHQGHLTASKKLPHNPQTSQLTAKPGEPMPVDFHKILSSHAEELTKDMDTGENEKRWRRMWGSLHWKLRPLSHFEPYWMLLHRRSQMALEKGVGYETGNCLNCKGKDDDAHAYVNFLEVRKIWMESVKDPETSGLVPPP